MRGINYELEPVSLNWSSTAALAQGTFKTL